MPANEASGNATKFVVPKTQALLVLLSIALLAVALLRTFMLPQSI